MGRLRTSTASTASDPVQWTYAYDTLGHLTTASLSVDSHVWTLHDAYDANGALRQITYPDGRVVAYAPDALGRPTQAGSYATGASYLADGALEHVAFSNGTDYLAQHNTRHLLSNLTYARGNTLVISRDYSYDKRANLTHVQDLAGADSQDFSYDALNRLVSAQATGLWGSASYVYDALNNLRQLTSDGQTRDYAYIHNRLTSIRRGGALLHQFSYDADGNTLGKDSQTRIFDVAHRLLSIPGQASYTYDAAGQRVKATGSQTVYSVYSRGSQLMMQWNQSTNTTTDYIYLGKKPIAQVADATTTYVYTSAQGSPLAHANAAGTLTARYSYHPYGLQQTGPVNHGPGYTGHVNDPATGLVYMQQRYYDPAVGRFISPDPVGPTPGNVFNFGRYTYANDNPVRYIDPTGAYTCNRKENADFCKKIDKYVDNLHKAEEYYQQGPRTSANHKKYLLVKSLVNRVGEKGKSGPLFAPANFKNKTVAKYVRIGKIVVDPDQVSGPGMGAASIGHEIKHVLDNISFKKNYERYIGTTHDKATAKKSYTWTETNAYQAQSVVLGAFGGELSPTEMQKGIQGSVNGDMQRWIRANTQP